MGDKMTRGEIIGACIQILESMRRDWVPNPRTRGKTSTGNMAFNGLRYAIQGNQFIIWIDDPIAPYAPYTEYPWTSPYWGGKKNPNEGWWERFREEFARRLAAKLKGEIR